MLLQTNVANNVERSILPLVVLACVRGPSTGVHLRRNDLPRTALSCPSTHLSGAALAAIQTIFFAVTTD